MNQITLKELLDRILCADSAELPKILDCVKERFSELFPDQELLFLPAPGRSPDSQIAELQKAIALLAASK